MRAWRGNVKNASQGPSPNLHKLAQILKFVSMQVKPPKMDIEGSEEQSLPW